MEQNETPAETGACEQSSYPKVYRTDSEWASENLLGTEDDTMPRATLPEPVPVAEAAETKTQSEEPEAMRDALVRMVLAAGWTLFRDPNSTAYLLVPINGSRQTWRLRSDGFRLLLRRLWYQSTGKGLSNSVISDAIDTLDAIASFSELEETVNIRVARHNGDIYVDICDDEWRAVHISSSGWRIVNDPPVRFIRTKGMLPLPLPIQGGDINDLRPFINAPTDEIWCLVVSWILTTFSAGPFPVLVLTGEQGSAKSFLCRVLRQLIDPSEIEVTCSPREARDVMFAACNSHVLACDNLSAIPGWLSDLLCSIATGAAHRERKYHTNNGDEELFKAKNPIVLNGIDFAVRDDLLSRSFLVRLPMIADNRRQDEAELWASIKKISPSVLGGIFDSLSSILKNLPTTNLAALPRLADAALWVTAAEQHLGWTEGYFMDIYGGNRNQSAELALESDSFGLALHQFMTDRTGQSWLVDWKQLVSSLSCGQSQIGWPKNSKAVATRLIRLAPALRHAGIHWEHERDGNKRYYKIWTDVADVAI
jgi:hypothetical protein